LLVTIVLVM